jgi:hypothetical protein
MWCGEVDVIFYLFFHEEKKKQKKTIFLQITTSTITLKVIGDLYLF